MDSTGTRFAYERSLGQKQFPCMVELNNFRWRCPESFLVLHAERETEGVEVEHYEVSSNVILFEAGGFID